MLIIGNLDAGRLPQGAAARRRSPRRRASTVEFAETVLREDPGVRPDRRRRALARRSACSSRRATSAPTTTWCVKMITEHLGNLEKKNYQAIARDLKQPLEEIYEAAKVIMELRPQARARSTRRGAALHHARRLHPQGRRQVLRRAQRRRPAQAQDLRRSTGTRSAGGAARRSEYIQDKLRSAQWLIRSIQQRQRTIVKVTESILKFQREFFDKGIAHLKPLILRDVAEDIGMHESTVSRVTTNKYVHTPQGIFELKYFFNSGISRTDGDDLASRGGEARRSSRSSPARIPSARTRDQKIVELLKNRRHRDRPPHRREVPRAARHP